MKVEAQILVKGKYQLTGEKGEMIKMRYLCMKTYMNNRKITLHFVNIAHKSSLRT